HGQSEAKILGQHAIDAAKESGGNCRSRPRKAAEGQAQSLNEADQNTDTRTDFARVFSRCSLCTLWLIFFYAADARDDDKDTDGDKGGGHDRQALEKVFHLSFFVAEHFDKNHFLDQVEQS